MIDIEDKIFIAGRSGQVGSAIERVFRRNNHERIVGEPSSVLDLRNQEATENFFRKEQPDFVILAAAKVGGIQANILNPASFLYDNLQIQNNVIECARKYKVKKLLFLGSSCIYPRLAPQPMKEEYLMEGKLEPTNEGYAIAKIAGLKMCQYYRKQYGVDFISVMPCNIYGYGDRLDSVNSHVVSALISKAHNAKKNGEKIIEMWGTGSARREFLFVDDLAEACYFIFNTYSGENFINIGSGKDVSIRDLMSIVLNVVDYKVDLLFRSEMPDGMPQKLLDVSMINKMGWHAKIGLEEGIKKTYEHYLATGGLV